MVIYEFTGWVVPFISKAHRTHPVITSNSYHIIIEDHVIREQKNQKVSKRLNFGIKSFDNIVVKIGFANDIFDYYISKDRNISFPINKGNKKILPHVIYNTSKTL